MIALSLTLTRATLVRRQDLAPCPSARGGPAAADEVATAAIQRNVEQHDRTQTCCSMSAMHARSMLSASLHNPHVYVRHPDKLAGETAAAPLVILAPWQTDRTRSFHRQPNSRCRGQHHGGRSQHHGNHGQHRGGHGPHDNLHLSQQWSYQHTDWHIYFDTRCLCCHMFLDRLTLHSLLELLPTALTH